MNNLNSILIDGNLVRDPLLKTTPKGTQVCSMRFASNRYYKLDDQSSGFERETNFFDVETWGKLAESCNTKGKKGRGLRVVGRLKQNRWNDPEGNPRSRITIIAEHVEFRPEVRKDTRPSLEISFDEDDYAEEAPKKINYTDKELERVVF